MMPQVVHFSSHPHAIQVVVDRCTNPDCECAEVTFHLTEKREDAAAKPDALALVIRIDPETWQESATVSRPPAQATIVSEFLRDYPAAEKEAFAKLARQKKQTTRRLREYRFDAEDMNNSSLVAYSDIASEQGSVTEGGTCFSFLLRHEGHTYIVEDLYCKRPSCLCEEIRLQFLDYRPGAAKGGEDLAEEVFTALLTLDGLLTVDVVYNTCTHDEAVKIASAWQAEFGSAFKTLKWRYGKIKEIARRSSQPAGAQRGSAGRLANDWRVVQALSPATRPGRNDPCPCGSGRKFKRCCGRPAAVKPVMKFIQQEGNTVRETTPPQ